jgi:predicted flap endonuclease-1-like 5' DNA nuclease
MANVIDIEGIGEVYAGRLKEAGVATTEALLAEGATARGRQGLAERTGIAPGRMLHWVNRADLFRVPGVGEQYSDLLATAGVETVLELAQRVPEDLHAKLAEIGHARHLVRHLPSLEQVSLWVEQTKALPRCVSY